MIQRFLVTIDTEERTPADIATALVEAGILDPQSETVHVLAYGDADVVIEPGSSRMFRVTTAANPPRWFPPPAVVPGCAPGLGGYSYQVFKATTDGSNYPYLPGGALP